MIPKELPGLRIVYIHDFIVCPGRFIEQCPDLFQIFVYISLFPESRPYGKHQAYVVTVMQLADHFGGMVEVGCIKFQAVPMFAVTPVFPVLYDIIERYLPFTVFFYDIS